MKKTIFFLALSLLFIGKSNAQSTMTANTYNVAYYLGWAGTSAHPLPFKIAGTISGWIDNASPYNTCFGYEALQNVTSPGTLNTAVGLEALGSNSFLSGNTAIGDSALYTQTYTVNVNSGNIAVGNSALYSNNSVLGFGSGTQNTAVGEWSLRHNTTGALSTANGYEALYSNTTGITNTAIGSVALFRNTTGSTNTAIGGSALNSNTTGFSNTAMGVDVLGANATGYYNTAIGDNALGNNVSGSSSTSLGTEAGYNNTESWNTFIGDSAGFLNTTGTYNTYLGYMAGNESANITTANSTFLGYSAGDGGAVTLNTVYIGNTSVAKVLAEVAPAQYSDRRIKDNIQENVPGLAFVNKLHPVTYNLNIHKQNDIMGIKDNRDWAGKYDIEKVTQTGFIAQQVDSAAQSCGYNFDGVLKPETSNDLYALKYTDFVVPLVKAVQELNAKNDGLNSTIDSLRSAFKDIQNCLNQICAATGNTSAGSPAGEQNVTLSSTNSPLLYQNSPNPFSTGTKINYYLPEGTTGATIVFYDSYGNQVKAVQVSQTGNGTLNITPDNLTNGIYSYSLVIGGNIIDTKRMVLQK